MAIVCPTVHAASKRILSAFVGVYALFSEIGLAYILDVTTCNLTHAETGDTIVFGLCQGGTYCTPTDEVSVTTNEGLGVVGMTIGVPVSVGYVPTTVVVSNPANNGWCLEEISWESGDNLLGDSGGVWFDSQFGVEHGCYEGLSGNGSALPCQGSWRFFNINGADNYTYDVKVTACEGTQSATVQVSFCSTAWCSADSGELVNANLTMNGVSGGLTSYEVAVPFNPLALKLSEVDADWCADAMTLNGFTVLGGNTDAADFNDTDEDGTRTMIIPSLQQNGIAVTPSPTKSPTPVPASSPTTLPVRPPTPSPSPAPTTPATPATARWSIVAACVVGVSLVAVLALTFNSLRKHFAAQDESVLQSLKALWPNGSFWSTMVVLAGLFVTLNIFSLSSMWGIVGVCAGFVFWCVVLAWFIVFQTGTGTSAAD